MCFILCCLEVPTISGLVYAGGSALGMTEATLVQDEGDSRKILPGAVDC